MNHSVDTHFPSPDVTIIAEPGRFYVSSAYTLACRVHSKREVRQNGKFNSTMYYINDGVYGSFNCNLYDHKICMPITLKSADEELFKSSVWGPTCDALDQVTISNKYTLRCKIKLEEKNNECTFKSNKLSSHQNRAIICYSSVSVMFMFHPYIFHKV